MGALLHEPLGRGKANAAASPCDDRDFSLKPFHGFLIVTAGFKFAKLNQAAAAYAEGMKAVGRRLDYHNKQPAEKDET